MLFHQIAIKLQINNTKIPIYEPVTDASPNLLIGGSGKLRSPDSTIASTDGLEIAGAAVRSSPQML